MVEFALIVPLLFLIVVATLDIGRVVWAMDSTSNAAREAARFAIVRGGSVQEAASLQSVKDVAVSAAVAAGGTPVVTVCYGSTQPTTSVPPSSCTADTNASGSGHVRGTPVTVVVRVNVGLIASNMLGMGPFTVTGSSLMSVNN